MCCFLFSFALFSLLQVVKCFGELSSFVIPVWQGREMWSLKYSTFLSIFILLFSHFSFQCLEDICVCELNLIFKNKSSIVWKIFYIYTFIYIYIWKWYFFHTFLVCHTLLFSEVKHRPVAWAGEGYLLRETSVLVIHLASKPFESGHLIMTCFGKISN